MRQICVSTSLFEGIIFDFMDANWNLPGESQNTNKLIIGRFNSHPLGVLLLGVHAAGHMVVVVDCQAFALEPKYSDLASMSVRIRQQVKGSEMMLPCGNTNGFNPFWFSGENDYSSKRKPSDEELERLALLLHQLSEMPSVDGRPSPLVPKLRDYYASDFAVAGLGFNSFHAFLSQERKPKADDGWVPVFLRATRRFTSLGQQASLMNELPHHLRAFYEVKNNYLVIGTGHLEYPNEKRADNWEHVLVLLHTVDALYGHKARPLTVVLPYLSHPTWANELGLLIHYVRNGPRANREVIATWSDETFGAVEPGVLARRLMKEFDFNFLSAQPFGRKRMTTGFPLADTPLVELDEKAQEVFFQLHPGGERRALMAYCTSSKQMEVFRLKGKLEPLLA